MAVKRIIIVEGALQGNGIGIGTGTGNMKGTTGTEIMREIGIMLGTMGEDGKETEIEIVKGTETGIGIMIVTACEMMITAETGTETVRGMVGKGNAETETVVGTGAAQGAGIDETETVKMESTAGGVVVAVLVLEAVVRMASQERNRRGGRKRKRRRVKGMLRIRLILRS